MKKLLFQLLLLCFVLDAHASRDDYALEKFDIGQLTVMKTITRGQCRLAYVKGPDHALYLLSVGDYIGKNGGLVIRIEKKAITVRELVRNGTNDDWVSRDIQVVVTPP
jgi:Tfp pilus assembly protein PilP